jgi:hypothetical protein
VDQGILDLKPWFRLKVEEYGPYVASQQRFLVYGKIGNFNGLLSELTAANVRISWLLSELIAANMQIELKGQNGNSLLFLVSRKE